MVSVPHHNVTDVRTVGGRAANCWWKPVVRSATTAQPARYDHVLIAVSRPALRRRRAAGAAEAQVEVDAAAVSQQDVADDALRVLVRPAVARLNQTQEDVLQLLALCSGQRVLVDIW